MATTNKPKKYRIYKYASEINLSTDAIIDFLKSKDYDVKNHMALLTDEMLSEIQSHFKKDIDKSDEHKRKLAKFNKLRAEKSGEEAEEVVEETPVVAEPEVEEKPAVEVVEEKVEEEPVPEVQVPQVEVETKEEVIDKKKDKKK